MSSKPKSLFITSVLVKTVFLLLIASIFFIPYAVGWYDGISSGAPVFWPLCICLYAILVPAFILVVCLNKILTNIKTDKIFTYETVRLLRILSYCCFTAAAVFAALGIFLLLAFLLCFAAAFMGLILRVLKNIFEQAVFIREENDYTI